jgi:hypothetical protein
MMREAADVLEALLAELKASREEQQADDEYFRSGTRYPGQ